MPHSPEVVELMSSYTAPVERGVPTLNIGGYEIIDRSFGQVWWKGKQWVVTELGIDSFHRSYFIAKDKLLEEPWPIHMNDKAWVDIDDFTTAWLVALVLHDYKKYWNTKDLLEIFRRLNPK